MAVPIRMPDLGTTVEEFPFMNWLVNEGDVIALGDPLAEIETDKAVTLLESPAKGVLLKQVAQAGEIVHTGDIVAYVGTPGETIADTAPETVASNAAPAPAVAPVAPADAHAGESAFLVRNLAASLQVDLGQVRGTGVGGAVTRDDVLRASASGSTAAQPPAPAPTPSAVQAPIAPARLSRGQIVVARNVVKSWTEIPHLYMSASIDMTAAQRARAEYARTGNKVSYDALILQAMARALAAMPLLGAKLQGEEIVSMSGIHLALAIGIDNELFLPVLRDVDRKSPVGVQADIAALVAQVQGKAIPPDALRGGCMALSNLGMYPIDDFDPIIFPEHSAILAVGAIQPTPIAVDGFLGIKPIMRVRLAVDHRLINGRTAADFICKIKEILETV